VFQAVCMGHDRNCHHYFDCGVAVVTSRSFILPAGNQACLSYLAALCLDQSTGAHTKYLTPNKEKTKYRVTVERYRKTRSNEQNRYLWGVAYEALEKATGQPKQDWHEYMLGEHFGWEEVSLFGKKKIRPLHRSSKVSTVEFMDFVEFIQQRAAEHGLYIPDPNE